MTDLFAPDAVLSVTEPAEISFTWTGDDHEPANDRILQHIAW